MSSRRGLLEEGLPSDLRISVQRYLTDSAGRSVEVVDLAPMTGGCIHNTLVLSTNLGDRFFLKWSPDPQKDAFAAEADGLRALSGSRGPRVPSVIGHSAPAETPSWLLLEFVPHGPPAPDYWETLGRGLANLHTIRSEPYGWNRANYIGSLPQANDPTDAWEAFWWTRRLLPQLELAREGRRLPGRWEDWELLQSGLPRLVACDAVGASLLHGDLWSGNVFPGPTGQPVLVDPAVYRGHGEVDLAMTELFGGFPALFYSAYEAVRPLDDGYREARRPLYQLYPLLVHVNLFGGSYVNTTARTLQQLLQLV